jgi:hydroxymethylpyrimidine pyrophosphatase-like HAD family hydrolase
VPTSPRLIIFDLDGTALPALEHRFFNHALINVVARLQDQGVHITIATGRSHASLLSEPTVAALDLRDPLIVAGGALIIDPKNHTLLYEEPLPVGALDMLRPVLEELDINSALWDDYSEADFEAGGLPLSDLPNDTHPYFLNLPRVRDAVSEELLRRIATTELRALAMNGLWPGSREIHILSRRATKYHATRTLQRHFGVPPEETVGIGDGHNDLDLFDAVGHAVAVDNAVEPLRLRAHEIIGHVNENGLMHYLNTLVN